MFPQKFLVGLAISTLLVGKPFLPDETWLVSQGQCGPSWKYLEQSDPDNAFDLEMLWFDACSAPYELVRDRAFHIAIVTNKGARRDLMGKYWSVGGYREQAIAEILREEAKAVAFVQFVLQTHSEKEFPTVVREAKNIWARSGAERTRYAVQFFNSGFSAAKLRDVSSSKELAARKAALVEEDRKFVKRLAAESPGEFVREAASHALQEGATDDDVVAFFASGWMEAENKDRNADFVKLTKSNILLAVSYDDLIQQAKAAQTSIAKLEGEQRKKAISDTLEFFSQAGNKAGQAQSLWTRASNDSLRQANLWQEVLNHNSLSPANKEALFTTANTSKQLWLQEINSRKKVLESWLKNIETIDKIVAEIKATS